MNTKVGIIDYGLGNLHSVKHALSYLGVEFVVADCGDKLQDCSHAILPGVGSFTDGMKGLHSCGHVETIKQWVHKDKPLMGICLGAQLLFNESDEFGCTAGLGVMQGRVEAIPKERVKVPHVGWAQLLPVRQGCWDNTALAATEKQTWAYFVHSFHIQVADPRDLLAVVDYQGHQITAAVGNRKVIGCQFHPEKSGSKGLKMISTFLGAS